MKTKIKLTRGYKARAKARVAIAKDVIAQVKKGKYEATTGIYVGGLDTTPVDNGKSVDLRSHLKRTLKRSQPCSVCALGSAFLSCVRIYDRFQLNSRTGGEEGVNYKAMRRKLQEFFGPYELGAIESSFERHRMGPVRHVDWDAVPYGYKQFLGDLPYKDRLIWLMKAIIRIGGENRITLKALEQQALLSIVLDPEYKNQRWSRIRPSIAC